MNLVQVLSIPIRERGALNEPRRGLAVTVAIRTQGRNFSMDRVERDNFEYLTAAGRLSDDFGVSG